MERKVFLIGDFDGVRTDLRGLDGLVYPRGTSSEDKDSLCGSGELKSSTGD